VETLLKTRDVNVEDDQDVQFMGANSTADLDDMGNDNLFKNVPTKGSGCAAKPPGNYVPHDPPMVDGKPAEMMSLGLEEPMPTQDVIDDL